MIMIGGTEIEVPMPELRFRKRNNAVFKKMMQAREETFLFSVLSANRIGDTSSQAYQDILRPSMRHMEKWALKDIDRAAERIAQAREADENIGLVTDFDVDGISSACVMYLALTDYLGFPKERVQIFVNNRMKFGYGFTLDALENIYNTSKGEVPTLLITADQGSKDNATVKQYKADMTARGFEHADVIVTDHHHINPNELCPDAAAFVNPQRPDDEFVDNTICGCVVALLTMAVTRDTMIAKGLAEESTPSLSPLLTYAGLATVADCVSIQSPINRCIVRSALRDINNEVIPAWAVLRRKHQKKNQLLKAEDLAFTLAPAINADSRTGGDGGDALDFLLAKTEEEALESYARLTSRNERRKEVDLAMQEAAISEASDQYYAGRRALIMYLPDGTHGIHGIVASRVKERFECPTIVFSPVNVKEKDHPDRMITGSGRCIDNLSIIDVYERMLSEIDMRGGGHPAAMGLKMRLKDLPRFRELMDEHFKADAREIGMSDRDFYPHVMIDHLFQQDDLSLLDARDENGQFTVLKEVSRLEPYGQKFEKPIFAFNMKLMGKRPFGAKGKEKAHLSMEFRDAIGKTRTAVSFNFQRYPWVDELEVGLDYTVAGSLKYDDFRGEVAIQVESIAPGFNEIVK
jgi:single-stranded-DNA-specific exonuclease